MIQYLSRRRFNMNAVFSVVLLILSSAALPAQDLKTYQAENAIFYHAKIETEHAGFSGDGYVNFDNETGSYIEFTVFMADTDTQTVYIRYANGATSARPMEVSVDSAGLAEMPDFNPTGAWTNWALDSIDLFLVAGANRIRFTSSTPDGGPNIDRIDVTGMPGVVLYSLNLNVIGSGRVEITPSDTIFPEGTPVELCASPDSGWNFREWRGDTSSTDNPINLIMNSTLRITALFVTDFDTAYQCENSPIGFAAVDTLEQNGTYGGAGGDTVVVTTGAELFQILDSRRDARFDQNHPPLVIMVRGKLTWAEKAMMDFKENYDVSLIGEGTDAQIEGFGLNLFRSHNIIIRNIEFRNAPDDCINITDPLSHHIWIDHCSFSDSPDTDPGGDRHDGLLDIKHGASYITVSWCHFYNHRKSNLIGHSENNGDEDIGRLKITYHHNWWENTVSRNPRTRFGEIHVFNNFYDNSENIMSYGVGVTCYAHVLVEANYFERVPIPILISQVNDDYGTLSGNPAGYAMAVANYAADSGPIVEYLENYNFDPGDYYDYQPDDPTALPVLLPALAGSGKLDTQILVMTIANTNRLATDFTLAQNYPNPFNPVTQIEYTIPREDFVHLTVYNLAGQVVQCLVAEAQSAGSYRVCFDASGLPSGMYLYRLAMGNQIKTRKLMLLK